MSKLLIFLGILLILVGGAGMISGFAGISTQFTDAITQATSADAEDLCKSGETLDTDEGASEYNPGQGYGRNVRYFCVNDAGVRREVTGDFIQGMFGDVGAALLPMLSGGLVTIVSPLVVTLGFILAVLGFVFSRRRASPVTHYVYAGSNLPPTFNMPAGQKPSSTFAFPAQPQPRGDLTAKLRQLDEARQANLISEEEYQQMRQQLLEAMQ